MSADHSDVMAIQKRLKSAARELNDTGMISLYAMARQTISYDSDRRKNLLAKYMVKYLKEESAAAAEAMARSDAEYQKELDAQADELKTAEGVIAKRRAVETSWESARSLLSFEKQLAREIPTEG